MKLVAMIPPPTEANGRIAALASSPVKGDNIVGKFDYTLNQSNRLSFRFYMDYQRGVNPFPNKEYRSRRLEPMEPGTKVKKSRTRRIIS